MYRICTLYIACYICMFHNRGRVNDLDTEKENLISECEELIVSDRCEVLVTFCLYFLPIK